MPEQPDATPAPAELPPAAVLAGLARLVEDLAGRLAAPAPELWTREQLAGALSISIRSLTELEASGGIGPMPIHLGGSPRLVRYHAPTVKAWLAAGAPNRVRWQAIEAAARTRKAG